MALTFIVFILLAYYFGKNSNKQKDYNERRSKEIANNKLQEEFDKELVGAKSKHEKDLILRLKSAYEAFFGISSSNQSSTVQVLQNMQQQEQASNAPVSQQETETTRVDVEPSVSQRILESQEKKIDNTSLQPYFGAFLFITSVGLFVGFADLTGGIRTLLIVIVMAVLYSGGFWLWSTNRKLKDVGMTFMGIGMAIVPFVGVAFYIYVLDQTQGSLVWLLTSVFALCLYWFTLMKTKATFIAYMLIASVVSLVESSIGVLDSPVYYFAWAFAAVGLGLRLMSLSSVASVPEFKEASGQSAQVMIPLTLFASLMLVDTEGTSQLAVSLLIASLYYAVEAVARVASRYSFITASHALLVSSGALFAFSVDSSQEHVAFLLVLVTVLHILLFVAWPNMSFKLSKALIPTIFTASVFGILLSMSFPEVLMVSVFVTALLGFVVTVRTLRQDALIIGLTAWLALPIVFGQVGLEQRLELTVQAWVCLIASLPVLLFASGRWLEKKSAALFEIVVAGSIIGLASGVFVAGLAGAASVFWTSCACSILLLGLSELYKKYRWQDVLLFFVSVPVVYSLSMVLSDNYISPYFTLSVLWCLIVCIGVALRHRAESARYISSFVWLLVPFALGVEEIGPFSLDLQMQMWLYIVVAVTLSLSRAIARGRIFSVEKASLLSLAKSSSNSYILAGATASVIVTILSFRVTSVMSAVFAMICITVLWVLHGVIVEKDYRNLVLIPVSLQVVILRVFEPYTLHEYGKVNDEQTLILFSVVSCIAGLFSYIYLSELYSQKKIPSSVVLTTLTMMFVAPASIFFGDETLWIMPVSLLVAGLALLHYNWKLKQDYREWAGAVPLVAALWFLECLGVTNLQVYTHVLAAFFGLYAYWRSYRGERHQSDGYLWAMLGVATVPLLLQALDIDTGQIYGITLLLQQIGFLLLGIAINRRFVIRWGLYVAVGTVLYQLRDLGWAMLSVLSLFIIGIAVTRSLRESDDKNKE